MKVRKRTRARELALQLLYEKEFNGQLQEDQANVWEQLVDEDPESTFEIKDFCHKLVQVVTDHREELDLKIKACAENWDLSRMALVDRNILRMGAGELLFFDDIPTKVAINEAIELAKRYGEDDSPRFVNGILDKIAKKYTSSA